MLLLCPGPKGSVVLIYDQPFSRYNVAKNRNALNDLRLTLKI